MGSLYWREQVAGVRRADRSRQRRRLHRSSKQSRFNIGIAGIGANILSASVRIVSGS